MDNNPVVSPFERTQREKKNNYEGMHTDRGVGTESIRIELRRTLDLVFLTLPSALTRRNIVGLASKRHAPSFPSLSSSKQKIMRKLRERTSKENLLARRKRTVDGAAIALSSTYICMNEISCSANASHWINYTTNHFSAHYAGDRVRVALDCAHEAHDDRRAEAGQAGRHLRHVGEQGGGRRGVTISELCGETGRRLFGCGQLASYT